MYIYLKYHLPYSFSFYELKTVTCLLRSFVERDKLIRDGQVVINCDQAVSPLG